jgi:hypothetical protein
MKAQDKSEEWKHTNNDDNMMEAPRGQEWG